MNQTYSTFTLSQANYESIASLEEYKTDDLVDFLVVFSEERNENGSVRFYVMRRTKIEDEKGVYKAMTRRV